MWHDDRQRLARYGVNHCSLGLLTAAPPRTIQIRELLVPIPQPDTPPLKALRVGLIGALALVVTGTCMPGVFSAGPSPVAPAAQGELASAEAPVQGAAAPARAPVPAPEPAPPAVDVPSETPPTGARATDAGMTEGRATDSESARERQGARDGAAMGRERREDRTQTPGDAAAAPEPRQRPERDRQPARELAAADEPAVDEAVPGSVSAEEELAQATPKTPGMRTGGAALDLPSTFKADDGFAASADGLAEDDSSVSTGGVAGATAGDVPAEGNASFETGSTPSQARRSTQAATLDRVQTVVPRVRVSGFATGTSAAQVEAIEGVSQVARIQRGAVAIRGRKITVAGVDPRQFRAFTPDVTAVEAGVWRRLAEGDAAFTHEAAARVRARLGRSLEVNADLDGSNPQLQLSGAPDPTVRVGAYASNGAPGVADIIITRATAAALGLQAKPRLLVALDEGADPTTVAEAVAAATGGSARVLEQPQVQQAFLTGGETRNAFEPFDYVDNGDGMITIDPAWVARNIVRRQVPVFTGEVVCHRLMVDQLAGALAEVEARGLAHLIDPSDYGGCYVPRHILFNPSAPLSMHAWGLAVDFNVATNGYGAEPQLDMRIVEIFERWGFVWGGRWSTPDGMHFELGALLDREP